MKIKDAIRTLKIYHKRILVAFLTHMQNWEAWDICSAVYKFDYETNTYEENVSFSLFTLEEKKTV